METFRVYWACWIRRSPGPLLDQRTFRRLGFGVATQACFFVPFGGVLVMPVAVAGATVLAREILPDERGPAYEVISPVE